MHLRVIEGRHVAALKLLRHQLSQIGGGGVLENDG
jgi:hypothetical protein